MAEAIERFFGVYLLYNVNPKFKGRTYIGYTVNPNRRIQQHNKGKHAGGAKRTHGRGPWEMVLIIHGFPNDISALRFEWAWQNPQKSRRLRHLAGKKKKETPFLYRFRIVSEMLRLGPWKRFALTIRWLKQNYVQDFPPDCRPPIHIPIVYGPVKIKTLAKDNKNKGKKGSKGSNDSSPEKQSKDSEESDIGQLVLPSHQRCSACYKRLQADDTTVSCIHPKCSMVSHIVCLAEKFLAKSKEQKREIIPVEGTCPNCKQLLLWGDLIRFKMGCYQNLEECTSDQDQDASDEDD
ncbi:structure-specific endonuclease subunit slx1-like [Mizuhopecten yessoensis]|uniref:Structure-specific endonuclease subunit SLX1 homolog n=1 Tax=Mizuhopecten yessoensis TaxID=6573 RepID=A0A210Q0J8_MIZYE|nr:structure-specific endonuclease subunit slx1-like [Mizuhopecten yessoensis]XP_021370429.1 structure-specific endonuclease subunit slx1-like [Mizuhopecten yessoensis]XP_021370430.1 structure-specific endonuclease subunit slx1-like [Mizuhopecten yessoensis]OWF42235.1 Structure-specific endonuclease subunit slx1 [Mizuhopecten yessoensis]